MKDQKKENTRDRDTYRKPRLENRGSLKDITAGDIVTKTQ